MEREQINDIPQLVASGKMTWDQAVREMIVFILKNKAMFGLAKYDDDFISEFIIEFLSRGTECYKRFNNSIGTFLTFNFCFIRNIRSYIAKKNATRNMIDYHSVNECILNYEAKMESYQNIKYADIESPKVPYKYTPISYKDFQIACKTNTYQIKRVSNSSQSVISDEIKEKLKGFSPAKIRKLILVIALKSAYYITDEQIKKISINFDIDYEMLHRIVMKLKVDIEDREQCKKRAEMKRNKAYFKHRTLITQMEFYKDNGNIYSSYQLKTLDKMLIRSNYKWTSWNHKMVDGKVVVRPPAKLIANALGMSTRQVTYYQSTAKKLGIDLSKV